MSLHVDFFSDHEMDYCPKCEWLCPHCNEKNSLTFTSRPLKEIIEGIVLEYPDMVSCDGCNTRFKMKDLFDLNYTTESIHSEPTFGLDKFK